MNEIKKVFVLLVIVFVLILLVISGSIYENSQSKKYLKEFYSDFNGTTDKLILIGRDNCSWCELFKPILDGMKDNYGFEYTYVDTNELTSSVFNKLLKDISVSKDDFGTPLTLVVKDGMVVDSISGFVDEKALLEFLKKNSFVDESEELLINYIDYSDYKKLLKSNEKEVLVVGQTGCSYCIKAKSHLNRIIAEKNIEINFINVDELDEDEITKFTDSLDFFSENEWGTPLMLIIQDGKVLDYSNGLLEYDGYINLLNDVGMFK